VQLPSSQQVRLSSRVQQPSWRVLLVQLRLLSLPVQQPP
jgi:hypothetical protein